MAYLSGEKTLQILYDKFFQKILNPEMHPERLRTLLSAVFGQEVEIVKVLSRESMLKEQTKMAFLSENTKISYTGQEKTERPERSGDRSWRLSYNSTKSDSTETE